MSKWIDDDSLDCHWDDIDDSIDEIDDEIDDGSDSAYDGWGPQGFDPMLNPNGDLDL